MTQLIESRDARAERVAEEASDAFWRVVAERYPEIRTGDFGPGETHEWMSACETALARWIEGNRPNPYTAMAARDALADVYAKIRPYRVAVESPTPGADECRVELDNGDPRRPGPFILITNGMGNAPEAGWEIGAYREVEDVGSAPIDGVLTAADADELRAIVVELAGRLVCPCCGRPRD